MDDKKARKKRTVLKRAESQRKGEVFYKRGVKQHFNEQLKSRGAVSKSESGSSDEEAARAVNWKEDTTG